MSQWNILKIKENHLERAPKLFAIVLVMGSGLS